MARLPAIDRQTACELLTFERKGIFTPEEEQHPWRALHIRTFNRPLLRVWDRFSGSQPNADGSLEARAPRQRLDTHEARKATLAIHADHKRWDDTPYISFQASAIEVKALADWRKTKGTRGDQYLVVIDPDIRSRQGLPVIHARMEMEYYGVPDPYNRAMEYYEDHYLCLWEITKGEVVGYYDCDDLFKNENWYNQIIMPAFQEFRERNRSKPLEFDLSQAFSSLAITREVSNSRSSQETTESSRGGPVRGSEDSPVFDDEDEEDVEAAEDL